MILEVNKKYKNIKGEIITIVSKVGDFTTDSKGRIYNNNCECISQLLIINNENTLDIVEEVKK